MVCLAVKFYVLPQATVLTACNLALEGLLIIIIIISCFKKIPVRSCPLPAELKLRENTAFFKVFSISDFLCLSPALQA